jgi:hypothetical protein
MEKMQEWQKHQNHFWCFQFMSDNRVNHIIKVGSYFDMKQMIDNSRTIQSEWTINLMTAKNIIVHWSNNEIERIREEKNYIKSLHLSDFKEGVNNKVLGAVLGVHKQP